MKQISKEKEEAMSQEALAESPNLYRGAQPGRPLDEITGNPIFESAHHMSRDSDDENELDALLVESGVNETGDDNDSRFANGEDPEELELADEVDEDGQFSAETEDEEDPDYKSREDDSDLGHLANSLPLQADRDL